VIGSVIAEPTVGRGYSSNVSPSYYIIGAAYGTMDPALL